MAVILEDWRYRQLDTTKVKMSSIGRLASHSDDGLRLYGRTIGHPTNRDGKYVYASPVVEFDAMTRTVKTSTGSEYRLGLCGGDEAEHLKHLQRDVLRNRKSAPVAGLKTRPPESAESAGKPKPAEPDVNGTIINLDLDSDEDHAFGRVFGHDHDDRHIDAIIEKEMADLERPETEQRSAPPPVRRIYDAETVEPTDEV
jgi:hypothetical protein